MTGLESAILIVGTAALIGVTGVLTASGLAEWRALRRATPHPAAQDLAKLVRAEGPVEPDPGALVRELTDAVFAGVLVRDLLTPHPAPRSRTADARTAPDMAALARAVATYRSRRPSERPEDPEAPGREDHS